jgi:proline dehydrogenase
LRAFFHLLARSRLLQAITSRYGLRGPSGFARRFIAGETVEEAIAAALDVKAHGLLVTLDYLGESVRTIAEADQATREYLKIIGAIIDPSSGGIDRNLSLKLTQLGLDVDRATAVDNLRRIFERADGFFIRIDMENSPYTEITLDIFETLWRQGYRQMGTVVQADLFRSERDLRRLNALGARVRLVKGAYKEPKTVAYAKKSEVDRSYARLLELLLSEGHYPAIATHDPVMIDRALDYAARRSIMSDRFEFQMLYGIRRDLQQSLVKAGHRVRVYIPFGRQWFPYFMRRLGERPANVVFVAKGILGERGSAWPPAL